MADKIALVEDFLNCHVCSEIFRDPVSLSCNHNFCSSCLKQFWERAGNQNCPICNRKSSKSNVGVNFGLKGLADSFSKSSKSDVGVNFGLKGLAVCLAGLGDSFEDRGTFGSDATKETKSKAVCRLHKNEPQLFCVDEQRVVCPVCEFALHGNHKVIPVEQAVGELKEQLQTDFKFLQDMRNQHEQVQEAYKSVSEHRERQLLSTERQIREEFKKLHQFLEEEEEARLAALREEEEQKRTLVLTEVKKTLEQISLLSDDMRAVTEELQKDTVDFLSSFKAVKSRAASQRYKSAPRRVSGALIDVAKHLGNLGFRVWEKMKEKVHFSPVILDPNSAHPHLCLSDDLTSVTRSDVQQQLADNPERHSRCHVVLGSEGFSSGTHSWEVEVGDHPSWSVGVVRETRNKDMLLTSSHTGALCFKHESGKYIDLLGQTFTFKNKLQRIRVQLDYNKGEVCFYEAEDMTLIQTYLDVFFDKVFPYFNIGEAGNAKTAAIKICPMQM